MRLITVLCVWSMKTGILLLLALLLTEKQKLRRDLSEVNIHLKTRRWNVCFNSVEANIQRCFSCSLIFMFLNFCQFLEFFSIFLIYSKLFFIYYHIYQNNCSNDNNFPSTEHDLIGTGGSDVRTWRQCRASSPQFKSEALFFLDRLQNLVEW